LQRRQQPARTPVPGTARLLAAADPDAPSAVAERERRLRIVPTSTLGMRRSA
jgi:hypothetical protein